MVRRRYMRTASRGQLHACTYEEMNPKLFQKIMEIYESDQRGVERLAGNRFTGVRKLWGPCRASDVEASGCDCLPNRGGSPEANGAGGTRARRARGSISRRSTKRKRPRQRAASSYGRSVGVRVESLTDATPAAQPTGRWSSNPMTIKQERRKRRSCFARSAREAGIVLRREEPTPARARRKRGDGSHVSPGGYRQHDPAGARTRAQSKGAGAGSSPARAAPKEANEPVRRAPRRGRDARVRTASGGRTGRNRPCRG